MDIQQNGKEHRLLLLAPLKPGCGNNTTASRIRDHLESQGIVVKLTGTNEFDAKEDFLNFVEKENITVAVGLHALHAGKCLRHLVDRCIPYAVIYGGTDLNEYHTNESHMAIMTEVVHNARFLVSFSEQMYERSKELWPGIEPETIRVIPQGNQIFIGPKSEPSPVSLSTELRNKLHLQEGAVIFTLVAGIRPVKDPKYLLPVFSEWHKTVATNAFLLVVGPELDHQYAKEFKELVSTSEGVIYTGVLPSNDTLTLMKESFAVVNSSHSEGMCVAILEAMQLCVPVIVRNNGGNKSVVKHRYNGMLYSTPQEFIDCATALLQENGLYESICQNAQAYVRENHSVKQECEMYRSLVRDLMNA